jgi:putative transposase
MDSQSTKTQYASEERGIDGGKLVKGWKRHIVVDILGDVLHVQVHAANVPRPVVQCCKGRPRTIPASKHSAGMPGIGVRR